MFAKLFIVFVASSLLVSISEARGRGRGGRRDTPVCKCEEVEPCLTNFRSQRQTRLTNKETAFNACETECTASKPVTSVDLNAVMQCKKAAEASVKQKLLAQLQAETCLEETLPKPCDNSSGVAEIRGGGGGGRGGGGRGGRGGGGGRGRGRGGGDNFKNMLLHFSKRIVDTTKHQDLLDHCKCMKRCMRSSRPGRQGGEKACFAELGCRRGRYATPEQIQAAEEKCPMPARLSPEELRQKIMDNCQCAVQAGVQLAEGQTCEAIARKGGKNRNRRPAL